MFLADVLLQACSLSRRGHQCGVLVEFDPTEGPPSVAEAKCRRVLALLDDTSLGVEQAYTNSLRG